MEKNRLVFSGSGGQGVITASIILAEAAVMYEDLNAIQSQSYGPEARGGATRADVIISTSEIHFPKVLQPNTLICLTQTAYNKYFPIIRPGGLLVTDVHYVTPHKEVDARRRELPMYDTVMEKIGNPVVFNICVLGALIGLSDLVKPESILRVLEARIPKDFLDMNRQALELGYELGGASSR
jgi:2-oxoglutarate ferredoxin oxidoreductase subunit gamma